MSTRTALSVIAISATLAASASASDPVQWRVEDGGNGHWYQCRWDPTNPSLCWTTARAEAAVAGGYLATITSTTENTFLVALVTSNDPGVQEEAGPFIGATSEGMPVGQWRWDNGEPFFFTAWLPGEPDHPTTERFTHFHRWVNSGWNALPECGSRGYLVEWSADCNSDGLVDFGQIRAGQLIDLNSNNVPDSCEAGIAFASPVLAANMQPATIPLRDVDLGECLIVGIKPDQTLVMWSGSTATVPSGQFRTVSAGRGNAIAIRIDGTLVGFGDYSHGELNVPSGAFIDVARADATWHSAGVRTSGEIACWGYNNHGQCASPAGAFREVEAGGHEAWSGFTLAIRTDGSLAAWGNNTWGQRNVPAGTSYRSISTGYYHALALRNDNTIAGWGWNEFGQATPPSGQFVGIATGSSESLALRDDGTVVPFGKWDGSALAFLAAHPRTTKISMHCCEGVVLLESNDCDSDGIFDAVEIAATPALDANIDGVLDACIDAFTVPTQYATIQAAINAVPANSHRTVNVLAGIYHESFALNGKDVVIHGAPNFGTILDGTGLTTSIAVFSGNEPATAGLDQLFFRNANSGSLLFPRATILVGGALYGRDSSAFVKDCRFYDCRSDYGGAIYLYLCDLNWQNCTFDGCIGNSEGGGGMVYGCTGRVLNCVFTNNDCGMNGSGSGSGFKGVGAGETGESVILENCTFSGNKAFDSGGAIEFYEHQKYHPGILRLVNTSVTNNTSGDPLLVGAAGLRVIGQQSCCVLSGTTTICENDPSNIDGPFLVEGSITLCDCEADIFADGQVNAADLGILLSVWGPASAQGTGDLNHDGMVTAADISLLLIGWGVCPN